jgi:hypothetical protein
MHVIEEETEYDETAGYSKYPCDKVFHRSTSLRR